MTTTCVTLIDRLKAPSPNAEDWSRFTEIYTPLLLFWGQQRIGLSHAEAEDVAQDVLMMLMSKLPEFEYKADGSFRGWLRTVMLNKSRDFLRRKNRDPDNAYTDQLKRLDVKDAVELFTDQEYYAFVAKKALDLMKIEFEETTWQACWMTVVDGESAQEVSETLGISPNAVYLARSRVLRRLREEMAGMWEE